MIPFFPLRKIKRNGIYLFFGAVLVVMGIAAYLEYVATNTWNNVGKGKERKVLWVFSFSSLLSFSLRSGERSLQSTPERNNHSPEKANCKSAINKSHRVNKRSL